MNVHEFLIDKETEQRSKVFGEAGMTSEQRLATISQLFASAEEFIKEKKYPKALNEVAKVYRIDPRNYYAQAYSDRIRTLMRNESASKKAQASSLQSGTTTPPQAKPLLPVQDDVPIPPVAVSAEPPAPAGEQTEESHRFSLYRELLKECWADGLITPEESELLHRTRLQYSIPFDIHCQIEVDIKIDAYVDALRLVWLDGVVDDNEQEVLEVMRKIYGITQNEQAAAEKKFSALRASVQTQALVLVVDHDYNNSIFVARVLMSQGYAVKIERHPDDAWRFLNSHTPDLILSEAVFPKGTSDGFEFFQRIRSEEQYAHIPFLIMTDSKDEHIIQAGLRMGVDYMIPKPLHSDFMVSLIKGKIKSGMKPGSGK